MLKSAGFFPHPFSKACVFILESNCFSVDFQSQSFQGKRATHLSLNVDLEKMYTDKLRVNPK